MYTSHLKRFKDSGWFGAMVRGPGQQLGFAGHVAAAHSLSGPIGGHHSCAGAPTVAGHFETTT